MDLTLEQLEKLVTEAKERLIEFARCDNYDSGYLKEYMEEVEAYYRAMLDVQDVSWRLEHDHVLAKARDSLAMVLELDSQIVQEYYELIAMRKRRTKQERCF